MPKYEYACKSCGERLEVVQSFADAPLTECPACAGPLRKVFSAPSIAFKGSGFYRTDNRKRRTEPSEPKNDKAPADAKADAKPTGESKSEPVKADTGSKSESKSGSKSESNSKTESKSESKPKAAEAKTA